MKVSGKLKLVAMLIATKSNGSPPPLPGCALGLIGRVGFDGFSLVEEGCSTLVCEVCVADSIAELGTTADVMVASGVVDAAVLDAASVETGCCVDVN